MTACTCKIDLEAKLTERFKTMTPDATDHAVRLQGYAFAVVDNGMRTLPCMPYKAGAVHPLKKGGTKARTETGSMMFSFCPFCGVSLSDKPGEAAA